MERTFFNFTEKLKKPLHILMAFAMIICTAFTVPSFADDIISCQLPVFDYVPSTSEALRFGSATYGEFYVYSSGSEVYVFAYELTRGYGIGLFSYTSGSTYNTFYDEAHNYSNTYTLTRAYNDNLTYTVYYLFGNDGFTNLNPDIPIFSSLNDGLDFYSNNLPTVDVPLSGWVNKPLTIPQGYAAVINTSNMTAGKGSFRLRANTGNLGNSNLWRDVFGNDNIQSGQAVYNTNTAITSYDFDDYPQLTWSPYEYSLVRATAYEYFGEATKSNTYTYIFNPIQSNATSIKTGQNTNSYITLYMNEQFDGTVKLYPLTSMAALGQGQTINVGNDESENSGSGDISNGTWTNSDGNVYTPPQGGGNGTGSSLNPLESIAGTVEHLGEVLNQFVGGLSTILTAPVEAIQTLINNGSAFVSQLSGLYSWLPAQVYSTLTSAIVLCITVGVLKVLL